MNDELAKKLKETGFSQTSRDRYFLHIENGKAVAKDSHDLDMKDMIYHPTLSELIEACGEDFEGLVRKKDKWLAGGGNIVMGEEDFMFSDVGIGQTPKEAVANLWLFLNKK